MTLMAEGFFVWNPEMSRPEMQHKHAVDAVNEAERMAKANPGQEFIVLRAMGSAKVEKPGTFQMAPGLNHADFDAPF